MTRHRLHVWGGEHLRETPSRVCRAAHCPHILLKRQPGCLPPRVPSQLLDYLMGWQRGLQPVALPRGDGGEPVLATWAGGLEESRALGGVPAHALYCDEGDGLSPVDMDALEEELGQAHVSFVKGFVQAGDPVEGTAIEVMRAGILHDFKDTIFNPRTGGDPPVRGQWGEAEIVLKPGVVPVKQRAFHLTGERRDAWVRLIDQLVEDGRI